MIKKLIIIFLAIIYVLASGQSVLAITTDQQQRINSDSEYYWPNQCSTNTTPTAAPVSPGSGAPDGVTFPSLDPTAMANAINTWIIQKNSSSALAGDGATIVAGAQHSNISPFLIVAIANKETSMADPGSYNVKYANNAFSREATSSQPNYPGGGINSGTLWYKWSSVKASVDFTAPENQGVNGGGDIAAYINSAYSAQISGGSILAVLSKYAPPSQNDTATYNQQVNTWIGELVKLSGASSTTAPSTPATDSSTSGSSSCCNSSNASSTSSGVQDVSYTDPARGNRTIGVTIYLPADGKPHPLLLFAPGRSQDSKKGDFYSRYLLATAAQGFDVAGINFSDNTTENSWPADAQDINFLTQKLPNEPVLNGKLSPGPIGLIGHSDGASVALIAAYGSGVQDKAISAVIAQDGTPVSQGLVGGPPILLMHGTNDPIQPISTGSDLIYPAVSSPYKAYAKFVGADHFSYITGNKNFQGQDLSSFNPAVDAITGAFMKRYLNNDNSAGTLMNTVAAQYPSEISLQESGNPNVSAPAATSTATPSSTSGSGCCSGAGGSGPTTLSGSNNEQQAFNYYVSKGLTPQQSAGIIGNFIQESNVSPVSVNGSSGATGIAQWLGGRLTNLQAYIQAHGGDNTSLSVQLDFSWQEFNGPYQKVLKELQGATDVATAAGFIYNDYEGLSGSGQGNLQVRATDGEQILQQFGGAAAGSGAVSSSCAPSSALVWPFATKDTAQYKRTDQGWDIQTAAGGNVYAIAAGTINLYKPNPGGFGNDYPVEQLDSTLGGPSDFVYYGHVHMITGLDKQHVKAGDLIAHTNTTDPENGSAAPAGWLEIGFAVPNSDQPIAQTEPGSQGEGSATTAGTKMHDILINVTAVPSGTGGP